MALLTATGRKHYYSNVLQSHSRPFAIPLTSLPPAIPPLKRMKAVALRRYGPPSVFEAVDMPEPREPGERDILVKYRMTDCRQPIQT